MTEIWLIIGVICIIVEFFAIPSIGFLFFGFAALSNALIIQSYPFIDLKNQITILGLLSLIWFSILYYPLKKYIYRKTTKQENYSDMIGKEVEVYSDILSSSNLGQVKWSGVIMNAYLAVNEKDAKAGDKLFINEINGNILTCSKSRPK